MKEVPSRDLSHRRLIFFRHSITCISVLAATHSTGPQVEESVRSTVRFHYQTTNTNMSASGGGQMLEREEESGE